MAAQQTGRIFISYRRVDSAGYAGRIYDRLAAHFGKDAIFMDVDTIEAGLDFVEVLENAVQSCDVLVALIGKQWLNIKDEEGKRRLDNPQDFVRIEVAAALSRSIRVIPVLVDGTPMPNSNQLPSNLKTLARRNAVPVNHYSFHNDANRLIEQLELALKAAEESKIIKAKELREQEAQKKRQAEIENLLSQADIALDLQGWELAKEKLEAVLSLEPEHVQAQVKLAIVERKLREKGEQLLAEEKAKQETAKKAEQDRKEHERLKREEKTRKEKEAAEKATEEKAEAERLAAQKAEKERLAKQEEDRLANEKQEDERKQKQAGEQHIVSQRSQKTDHLEKEQVVDQPTEIKSPPSNIQLQSILKWAIGGSISIIFIAISAWGISNLITKPVNTPSPEFSTTATIFLKATSTLVEPSPTSHPLTTADYPCTECHGESSRLPEINTELAMSSHGSGGSFTVATSNACAGCHSGTGFTTMIAAGQNPGQVETGDPNPTPQDCQTCHQIHTTNTIDDWALTTSEPVTFFAIGDATYDGGEGNLCVNCHQTRMAFPEATDGKVSVTSTHWGGHNGTQAVMLFGVGGAGGIEGKPYPHYSYVQDTCVGCHMGGAGPDANHTFLPTVATCVQCHADANVLDINGVQTEIKDKLYQAKFALQARGLIDTEGVIVVGDYPEAQAAALWNYLFVLEDKSNGVHNPIFANALLDLALEALK